MAKPATIPTHATDTNYTNGPESGSPTKETPPAGYLLEGYIPGDKFFSTFTNWILYWLCQWVAWLNSLGITVTSGEITYDVAKTRTIWIPGTEFRPVVTAGAALWDTAQDGSGYPLRLKAVNNTACAVCHIGDRVPTGCTITQVQVQVDPGAARTSTDRMFADLRTHNYGGAPSNSAVYSSSVDSDYDDTTAAVQFITLTGSLAVNNALGSVTIVVVAGNDASSNNDHLNGAFVTFTDPALRNG